MRPNPLNLTCLARTGARFSITVALAFSLSASIAQTVTLRSQPLRFTVPKGVNSSNFCTLTIPISGLANEGVDTVSLAVTGVPASGNAAASLSASTLTSNITYTVTLVLTNDATIAAGDYDMAVEATGAAHYRLPVPVQVASIWSGSDFTNAVSTNWSSAGNWIGGAVPGATDAVVFKDISGVANNTTTNVIITDDTTIASLRFSPETGGTRFNTVEILEGKKLSITGSGLSFSLHRDTKGAGQRIDSYFAGGGTLEVVNENAEIGVLVDNQQNATLDMRNLNNFSADVKRIGLGNFRLWPNVFTNGYTGEGSGIQNIPWRYVPLVWLAKTNVIKCSWVDPNNYEDTGVRDYAVEIGNDTGSGTTANIRFTLGLSNAFFIDSICWSHAGKGGSGNQFNFNAADSYALFRGMGGMNDRISVWAQGDASGQGSSGSNVRGRTVDFSNGRVDALIDRLWLGINRTNSTGQTIESTLTVGGASPGTVFDVNTAILGYQIGNNLNAGTVESKSYNCILNVNSNAEFKVNGDLHLGYTTATSVGTPNYPETVIGTLNINGGGVVMASNILCGGVTKLSGVNSINVNNNGRLIVTNAIGSADGHAVQLTLSGSCEITLLGLTAGQTNVFVNTFSAAAAGGVKFIKIPVLTGVSAYPVTIPLISYAGASPVLSGLSIQPPAGLYIKSVVDNTTDKVVEVTFTDEPPIVVVWRGNVNNQWNTTDKNWVTQVGGVQTNYSEGYSVVFDDSVGSGPATIEIPAPVTPGQVAAPYGMVVSNQNFTFNSGTVLGNSSLLKAGSGTLTIEASMSTGVRVESGALAGLAGTVGPVTLAPGATMTAFNGTINGGLTASNASVAVTGTVNGGLSLDAGALTNNGTINGSITIGIGSYLTNGNTINVTVPWRVTTNSTLVNNGIIAQTSAGANNGLTVDGSLKGTGKIYVASGAVADARVTMAAGSSLMIGNLPNEITSMTIATRLDFLQGSTTTFDVDSGTMNADKILLEEPFTSFGKVNFGAGNNPGGTFIVNRVTGPPFNLSTVLNFFDQTFQVPDNSNQAVPGFTPAPAAGLAWDTSAILTNLTLKVTGLPLLTNVITSTNITFSWPADLRGWRLEYQLDTNHLGIDVTGTNWQTVAYSYGGTNLYYPDTNDLSVSYFRSVAPIVTTNQDAYYRLNYP